MAKNNTVPGIKITDDHRPGFPSCNLCKISLIPQPQTADPHIPQAYQNDTIVGDVIGRIRIPTICGEVYVSVLLDLRSRYVSIELLQLCTTNEVTTHLLKFINLIERQPYRERYVALEQTWLRSTPPITSHPH